MNKKIKVIELINKMHANLDVPEKVKYVGKKYEYNRAAQDYRSEDGEWLFQKMPTFYGRWIEREVEILEDEEEIDIEEIGELPEDFDASFYDKHSIKANRYKINEILRAVKQLDKKINKED